MNTVIYVSYKKKVLPKMTSFTFFIRIIRWRQLLIKFRRGSDMIFSTKYKSKLIKPFSAAYKECSEAHVVHIQYVFQGISQIEINGSFAADDFIYAMIMANLAV